MMTVTFLPPLGSIIMKPGPSESSTMSHCFNCSVVTNGRKITSSYALAQFMLSMYGQLIYLTKVTQSCTESIVELNFNYIIHIETSMISRRTRIAMTLGGLRPMRDAKMNVIFMIKIH